MSLRMTPSHRARVVSCAQGLYKVLLEMVVIHASERAYRTSNQKF